MRITRVKLKDHPGVGTLDISFCDEEGNAFDTVILAGENGTGKTAILDAIRRLMETDNSMGDAMEITFRTDGAPPGAETENIDWSKDWTVIWEPNPGNLAMGRRAKLSQDTGLLGEPNVRDINLHSQPWSQILRVFSNEVSVNFHAGAPQSVTATEVDQPQNNRGRTTDRLAVEVQQLLVDVQAADFEHIGRWVEKNPDAAPPRSEINKGRRRFDTAFEYMFPTKRMSGTQRRDGNIEATFLEFGRETPLSKLSTGEKQIVFRGSFLLRSLSYLPQSIVLIDEPELSLHPSWQAKVVGFYERLVRDERGQQTAQLIIATHSPFIVHGSANAKVVVLEKDIETGQIRPMKEPTYPISTGEAAIRAFNIDAFLADARATLLVLTEGQSDVEIITTAWRKLNPSLPMPFELQTALGAKNIQTILNEESIFARLGDRKIVGLFDYDAEGYRQWNGVWSKASASIRTVEDIRRGLTKRSARKPQGWAMMLPVPPQRDELVSKNPKTISLMSIEFLFSDAVLQKARVIGEREIVAGVRSVCVDDDSKMAFARSVADLPAAEFEHFRPLFEAWEVILSSPMEQPSKKSSQG
jgi:predicted ATPase